MIVVSDELTTPGSITWRIDASSINGAKDRIQLPPYEIASRALVHVFRPKRYPTLPVPPPQNDGLARDRRKAFARKLERKFFADPPHATTHCLAQFWKAEWLGVEKFTARKTERPRISRRSLPGEIDRPRPAYDSYGDMVQDTATDLTDPSSRSVASRNLGRFTSRPISR